MAADQGARTFGNGIIVLKMELTSGTWYTLWAPQWIIRGEQWQAFLGDEEHIFAFASPAEVLAFIESTTTHDLVNHTKWTSFFKDRATRVVPTEATSISLVELPNKLAERPGYESTLAVTRGFDLLQSFGTVLSIPSINQWFRSYSILHNTRRGADHYATSTGLEEWSGIGRTVVDKWVELTDAIEEGITHPELDEDAVAAAQKRIDAAAKEKEEKAAARKKEEEKKKEAGDNAEADPYDSTLWAEVGIDPIRIAINSQYVYTLRCYVNDVPIFLGHNGEIHTFPNARALVRWIVNAPQHDLETLSTWNDVVTAANAGELEVTVHEVNQYSFAGLHESIKKGIDDVDSEQLARAYELLADAADWAGDDGVNTILLSYPQLQNYLAYMLGSPSDATPSAPFDEEAKGWKALEEGLIRRFTKF